VSTIFFGKENVYFFKNLYAIGYLMAQLFYKSTSMINKIEQISSISYILKLIRQHSNLYFPD
jgi:hypothetical protein